MYAFNYFNAICLKFTSSPRVDYKRMSKGNKTVLLDPLMLKVYIRIKKLTNGQLLKLIRLRNSYV